ncbi:hypothetical protein EDD85DRAFT_751844, partial [Armillaria nabsnona]
LGYHPANYCPDFIDYLAYENHRDSFLHSQRGRAALMAGGILGHLAKDIVEYRQVYYGPSDEVFASGISLQSDRGDYSYWDDDLKTEEVDLLCGIYQVDTGLLINGKPQTTQISWWPKPAAWEGSGLNVGFWSANCKAWF